MDTTVTIHRISLHPRSESDEKTLQYPLDEKKTYIGMVLQEFIRKLPKEVILDGLNNRDDINRVNKFLLFQEDPIVEDSGDSIYVSGIIKVAIDGYEALYKHPASSEVFNRTVEHFEYRPYFFMLAIPKKERFGLCFLQKISIHSISGLFYTSFHGFFQNKYTDFVLKHKPFSTEQVFAQLKEKGDIQKITMVRHEQTLWNENSDKEPKKEFKVVTKTEIKIPKPRQKLNEKTTSLVPAFRFSDLQALIGKGAKTPKKNEDSHFITLEGVDGEFDDLILSMDVNGKSRTFSLSNPDKNFHPNFVLENVQYKDGNPVLKSIKKQCKSLYKDLMTDSNYVV